MYILIKRVIIRENTFYVLVSVLQFSFLKIISFIVFY